MTPAQAETLINAKVWSIDQIRIMNEPGAKEEIARIDEEIKKLKEITGPRHVRGDLHVK